MAPVDFAYGPSPEEFVAHRLSLGHTARRLAGLAPEAREAFVTSVRARLVGLDAEDYVSRRPIVAGTARHLAD